MTAAQFRQWLAAMMAAGYIKSQADAARLLGVNGHTIGRYKSGQTKVSIATALACQALLNGLQPYP